MSSRFVDYTGEFVLNQGVPAHSQTGMNEMGVNLNMTFSTANPGGHFQVSTVPTVFISWSATLASPTTPTSGPGPVLGSSWPPFPYLNIL